MISIFIHIFLRICSSYRFSAENLVCEVRKLLQIYDFELRLTVAALQQGKKDLARMDVEVEDGYDSVDEMLNAGPKVAEDDDSDYDPEQDRRR